MRFSWWFRRALAAGLALGMGVAESGRAAAQPPPSLFVEPARSQTAGVAGGPGSARARRVALRVDLLTSALTSGASVRAPFLLNLFEDVALSIERERLEVDGRGQSSWVGYVAGDAESMASFTWNGRHFVGGVVTRGVAYDLETDPSGNVLVSERTQQGIVELPPRLPPASRDGARPAPPPAAVGGAPAAVDLLIIYTAAAVTRAGGVSQLQAQLANAVAVTNTALQRSAVNAVVTAVGVGEMPYVGGAPYVEPALQAGGLNSDLNAISLGGSVSATVEAARSAFGADLVALVTGRADSRGGCGIAWLGPSPDAVYSATEQVCLFAGQWSFSHELGHNFGAAHAPDDPGPFGAPYAMAYREGSIRTLMAYAVPGSPPRILNYSSATVREPSSGLPTGTTLQDNSRRLGETAPELAAYKATAGGPPLAPAAFTATAVGSTVTLTWTAPTTGSTISGFELESGPAPGSAAYGRATLTQSPTIIPNVPIGTYYLRLRSIGPGGVSGATPDAVVTVTGCVVPGPASITASISGGTVTLAWTASAGSGPTTYYVGVGTASGVYNLGVYPAGASTGVALAPPPGTYFVRAVATNACGVGAVSADAVVTIP